MEVPRKTENRATIYITISLSSKDSESVQHRDTCSSVFIGTLHDRQEMEPVQMSSTDKYIKKM